MKPILKLESAVLMDHKVMNGEKDLCITFEPVLSLKRKLELGILDKTNTFQAFYDHQFYMTRLGKTEMQKFIQCYCMDYKVCVRSLCS